MGGGSTPGSFTPSGKYVGCCGLGAYGQGGSATAPATSVWVWMSEEAADELSTDPTEVIFPNPIPSTVVGCGLDYGHPWKIKEVALEWLDARGTACEWQNPCVCVGSVMASGERWCSASLHTKDGGPSTNCTFCPAMSDKPANC